MVQILTLNRNGGSYSNAFGYVRTSYSNPSVTIYVTEVKIKGNNIPVLINIPQATVGGQPSTKGGAYKRFQFSIDITGYLDATPSPDSTQVKCEKLWNIFEFGRSKYIYGTYRGSNIFGVADPGSGGTQVGKILIANLEIVEDAVISEKSVTSGLLGSLTSMPKRTSVKMSLTYLDEVA